VSYFYGWTVYFDGDFFQRPLFWFYSGINGVNNGIIGKFQKTYQYVLAKNNLSSVVFDDYRCHSPAHFTG
jgi:hypothetical protein